MAEDKRVEVHWTRKITRATSAEETAIALKSEKDTVEELIKKAKVLIRIDEK